MKHIAAVLTAFFCICLTGAAESPEANTRIRFIAVDIHVDAGDSPLAAWQFEFTAKKGSVVIVGIEGGEHAAFKDAPYYDPAALRKEKAVVAAFNTGLDLPRGRTRVARIHLQVTGAETPEYNIRLATAASSDGERIAASITVAEVDTAKGARK